MRVGNLVAVARPKRLFERRGESLLPTLDSPVGADTRDKAYPVTTCGRNSVVSQPANQPTGDGGPRISRAAAPLASATRRNA